MMHTAHRTPRRLGRKQRERQAHRREMLNAAERVFVRKGYHLATVEEIAEEAEFAVGTIYNFFKNKEDLYTCVLEKIANDFMGLFRERVLSKHKPAEAIAALIELRLSHFEDHRGFFRVFLETNPGIRLDPTRALPESCAGLYDEYITAVNELFARGIKDGSFDQMDPFYVTLCLEGIINAFVAYWAQREPSEPLARRVEKLTSAFMGRLQLRLPRREGSR